MKVLAGLYKMAILTFLCFLEILFISLKKKMSSLSNQSNIFHPILAKSTHLKILVKIKFQFLLL